MIRTKIKKIIKSVVSPVFKPELNSIKSIAAAYQQMIKTSRQELNTIDLSCEGIVFSKDRAIQLHALLSSYFAYVKNSVKLYVIYTTSNSRNVESYEELKQIFSNKDVVFINEKAFKSDLENLLDKINAAKLFFMTDDGLFIDSFDMREIASFNPIEVIPSLIKGLDLTYCYIQNKNQSLPEFINPEDPTLPSFMKYWEWKNAESFSDWAYPLSLDMTFYNKKEIQLLLKEISYKGPNSLETALHQNYAPIFLQRKGVCYEKAKYVNIVCNIVNTEHPNRNTGLHSTESLLKKWEEGYRIQYEDFFGQNCITAEKSSFSFTKR